jgi:N-ethylmaleimide reductase
MKATYQKAGGKGAWMLNNGYERDLADQALQADADLIAFGKSFIANPDLGARLKQNGPYNTPDRATFYGGKEVGYTDYPTLPKAH